MDSSGQGTAVRVVLLLEAIAESGGAMTSADIATALRAPRSSVASLLRSLVQLSVLTLDRRSSTYAAGARLVALSARLSRSFVANESVLDLAADLKAVTDETVVLVSPADLAIEVVHVAPGPQRITLVAEPGQRFPLWGSAVGTAYLMTVPDPTIRSMYQRAMRRSSMERPARPVAEILDQVRAARAAGHAHVIKTFERGVSAIAAPLPRWAGPRPLVVSVGGPEERITPRKHVIAALLTEHIERLSRSRTG